MGQDAKTSIEVAAEPEAVWEALVTDGGLEPWMGEGATIDPRIDGSLDVPDPVGGRRRRGRVERLIDSQRLEFSWWPQDRPIERSRVSITLQPIEHLTESGRVNGTRITVTESMPTVQTSTVQASTVQISTVQASTVQTSTVQARATSTLLVGAWSWRLALVALAYQVARV